MAHYLTAKTLKCQSQKEIKPKTYQLNPEQTLFLGGLWLWTSLQVWEAKVSASFDNELKLHQKILKLEGASASMTS